MPASHLYVCEKICLLYFFVKPISFNWVACFFDIELYELFIYFGYSPFIGHIICKCVLPFCSLSECWVGVNHMCGCSCRLESGLLTALSSSTGFPSAEGTRLSGVGPQGWAAKRGWNSFPAPGGSLSLPVWGSWPNWFSSLPTSVSADLFYSFSFFFK